jgi:hypothetical protein
MINWICLCLVILPVSAVGYGVITGLFMPAFPPDDYVENE